jgi:hypothetical protein
MEGRRSRLLQVRSRATWSCRTRDRNGLAWSSSFALTQPGTYTSPGFNVRYHVGRSTTTTYGVRAARVRRPPHVRGLGASPPGSCTRSVGHLLQRRAVWVRRPIVDSCRSAP